MKYVNYRGEFLSVAGVCWRVEILLDTPVTTVMPLEFDDNPLSIEWAEESKEVPICGSTAELNIISPGDRSYTGLYTEDPIGVRMDAYRDGVLYWSGCMDPEFYEEPYSSAKGYTVSLTFSDFGALDRLRYDLTGRQSLAGLISMCLAKTGINYSGLNTELLSGSSEGLSLLDLLVESSNFYDEDKEAISLHEMLAGILQPLALRIVQRAGSVWVYDLNGLSQTENKIPIDWQSTDQMLGVDKVYNNVKITWDPYVLSKLEVNRKCWNKSADFTDLEAQLAINSILPVQRQDGTELYAYHYDQNVDKWEGDKTDLGFVMLQSRYGKGAKLSGRRDHMFYKIIPVRDGEDSEGIALQWLTVGNAGDLYPGQTGLKLQNYGTEPHWGGRDVGSVENKIITFDEIDLPAVHDDTTVNLRLVVNLLMDPRYNPYEEAPEGSIIDAKSTVNSFNDIGNFLYIPVLIKFKPNGSEKTYFWTNRDVATMYYRNEAISLDEAKGRWEEYDGQGDKEQTYGYLCWYASKDRDNSSAVIGWKKNRTAIPPSNPRLLTELEEYGEGQCMPYPDKRGGKIWVEVYDSRWLLQKKYPEATLDFISDSCINLAKKAAWLLMEVPDIAFESTSVYNKELDEEDVEYTGVLNESAREGLEIDTICGTAEKPISFARGAYFYPYGEQVTQIKRAGRYGQAENLLIGTLCSQFGRRKTKLYGTAAMNGEGVCTYTDEASSGVIMMLAGAVENLREDTVEGTWIEVSPDTYEEGTLS